MKGPVTEEITLYLSSENVLYYVSYVLKPATSQSTVVKVVTETSIREGPSPVLHAPIVVNPDGQPPEEVEKTFLQKYWIYMLPLVFILLTSGGGGGGGGE